MGTEYSITCKDCKITRDLDKFSNATTSSVTTRKEALDFQDTVKSDSFRAGLLVSFMGEHMNHDCVFHSENNEEYETHSLGGKEPEYKEDYDFWPDDGSEIKGSKPLENTPLGVSQMKNGWDVLPDSPLGRVFISAYKKAEAKSLAEAKRLRAEKLDLPMFGNGCPALAGLEYPEEKKLWEETFPMSEKPPNAND